VPIASRWETVLTVFRSNWNASFTALKHSVNGRTLKPSDFLGFSRAVHYNGGQSLNGENVKIFKGCATENLAHSVDNPAQPSG